MSSWRPLARRALSTLRPPAVAIRALKPMCLARLLLLGLYVGNMLFLYVNSGPVNRTGKNVSPVINLKGFFTNVLKKPLCYYSFSEDYLQSLSLDTTKLWLYRPPCGGSSNGIFGVFPSKRNLANPPFSCLIRHENLRCG